MRLGTLVSRNRTAILGVVGILIAAGVVAAARMPVSIFPEVGFHRVMLIARAGNLPVEQTVTALTQPLENAMAGVLGIDAIRSVTTRGGTQLDLVFGWASDMPRALQSVQAAMEEARGDLPAGVALEARLLDTSAFPIVGIAISAPAHDLADVSDFAIYEAAPQLRTIPGVYRVELDGAKVREYALTVDPDALAQYHLDLTAIENAVRGANVIAAAGRVRDGHQLTLAVVRGAGADPQALTDIVVAQHGGTSVTLGSVARVERSVREDFIRTAANGESAVLLGISRRPGSSAIAISTDLRARIAMLAQRRPDYHFNIFYDQADLVRDAIHSARDAIIIGLILAIAIVFLFVADWRATAVAAAVIPATILIACIALHLLGMSFNLMTLGGIAAGIGLILDDAIVVIENVHRHGAEGARGASRLGAALGEITYALIGSTLTPVAVLLPIALLGGVAGAFFRPLAVTMSVALLVSLALALTFTPAFTAVIESDEPRQSRIGLGDRLAASLSSVYARTLQWALRNHGVALGAAVGSLLLGVVAYRHVETGFVPVMDEGAFVLDYWAPAGAALEETQRLLTVVDQILHETPEVDGYSRRTGAELGFFLTETNRGDYAVRLRPQPRRSVEEVMADVRDRIHARVPGLRVEFMQILQDMIGDLSGVASPIEIKLFGTDPETLRSSAKTVAARIAAVPGVVDDFDGITEVGPTYDIAVDARRAALAGLDAETVQHWLETAITGRVVGQVFAGDRAIPLRLRYPDTFRERLETAQELALTTDRGGHAFLPSIAALENGPIAIQREREDLRPLVRVSAGLEGRDLGGATRDVRRALAPMSLPAGVTLAYGGLYASQQQAFRELVLVAAGSLACVGALLLIEFGSLAATAAIIIGSTLALSGSLVALWLTGLGLNVASIVGMIMVVGIVAKNGILLLDFAGRAYERNGDLIAALIEAGRVRLRPILMTTLAALAGLAPLAFGLGAGSEMQQPLAVAIIGGVSTSMVFSLLGVPVLYCLFSRAPRRGERRTHALARG